MFIYALVLLIFVDFGVTSNQGWDIIVFSQRWPITVCTDWQESKPDNRCNLPPNNNLWTVHGIWPNKIGTKGPFFCNKTWHFDPNELKPILNDLKLYWTNVEANTPLYSLWQHEWTKHGTCAAQLPSIDSQLSYFTKGLEWIQQFGMANILAKNNIKPSPRGYSVQDINSAIKDLLNKNPEIECVIDKHTKLELISEIRICFNRNLTLIDCDLIKGNTPGDSILTNCDLNKPVMYLDKLSETSWQLDERRPLQQYIDRLYKMHKLLQFLIWFTI